tara:strand:- start:404 stop:1273 length:870 start_codon:yes stop_codon:yes gene_type:complete
MLSKLRYILNESIRGFLNAWTPILLSTITIGISLIIISLSFYGYFLFINYSNSFALDYKLEIFFEDNISYTKAFVLHQEILDNKAIIDGEFIDKDKSSDKFKEYFNERIEEIFDENPLPFSGQYKIDEKYKSVDSLFVLSKQINMIKGVNSVLYDKEVLLKIYSIINKIMTVFSIIGFSIVIISIILVSNTTRMMIYSKKENINILSLMGATNLLIRIPFLLEGFIQGLIGAGFSIFLLFLLKNIIEYIFSPIIIPYDNNIHFLIILNIILGTMFGLIGSKRAISKYLP